MIEIAFRKTELIKHDTLLADKETACKLSTGIYFFLGLYHKF